MKSKVWCHEATERELTTTEIGEMIMHPLKKLDKVAYVRFASVIWTLRMCRSSWRS